MLLPSDFPKAAFGLENIQDEVVKSVLRNFMFQFTNLQISVARVVNANASFPTAADFVAPGFLNGWVSYGAPYVAAGYTLTELGFVFLRGGIKSGTDTLPAFILPANMRPASTLTFTVPSAGAFGLVTVSTSGEVSAYTDGDTSNVSLDGISFHV